MTERSKGECRLYQVFIYQTAPGVEPNNFLDSRNNIVQAPQASEAAINTCIICLWQSVALGQIV